MTMHVRRRALVRLVVAIGLVVTLPATSPSHAEAAGLPAWTGGISLYRTGSFTTQRSWLWCTAAGVQIVRNIVDHRSDHTTTGQRRYFDWMRGRNRYDLPISAGIDPPGCAAGLRRFVDDLYRLVSSRSFEAALRSAVTRMRMTNLPVALTVSHGNHGWILNGFRATADPARTSDFTVTSVRVTGPLYGLQSKNGYDMPPNTKLTTAQLKRFFTPWKYAPMPMVWDGRYVSIQPIAKASKPASKPKAPALAVAPSAQNALPTPSASPVIDAEGVAPFEPVASDAAAIDQGIAFAPSVVPRPPTAATSIAPDPGSASAQVAAIALGILLGAVVVASVAVG